MGKSEDIAEPEDRVSYSEFQREIYAGQVPEWSTNLTTLESMKPHALIHGLNQAH